MQRLNYKLSEMDFSVAAMDRFGFSRDNVWRRALEEAKELFAEVYDDDEIAIEEAKNSISAMLDLATASKHGEKARSSFRYFGQEKMRSIITKAYEGKLPFQWSCNWSPTTIQEHVLQLNNMLAPILLKRRSRILLHFPCMLVACIMEAIWYKGAHEAKWWACGDNLNRLASKAVKSMGKGVQTPLTAEDKDRVCNCVSLAANLVQMLADLYPTMDLRNLNATVSGFEQRMLTRRPTQSPPTQSAGSHNPFFVRKEKAEGLIDLIGRINSLLGVEFLWFCVCQEAYLHYMSEYYRVSGAIAEPESMLEGICRVVFGQQNVPFSQAQELHGGQTERNDIPEAESKTKPLREPPAIAQGDTALNVVGAPAATARTVVSHLDICIDSVVLDVLYLLSDISKAASRVTNSANETCVGDIMTALYEPWMQRKRVNFKKLFMLCFAFIEGVDEDKVDTYPLAESILSRIGPDGTFLERFPRGAKNRRVGEGLQKRAPGRQVIVLYRDSSESDEGDNAPNRSQGVGRGAKNYKISRTAGPSQSRPSGPSQSQPSDNSPSSLSKAMLTTVHPSVGLPMSNAVQLSQGYVPKTRYATLSPPTRNQVGNPCPVTGIAGTPKPDSHGNVSRAPFLPPSSHVVQGSSDVGVYRTVSPWNVAEIMPSLPVMNARSLPVQPKGTPVSNMHTASDGRETVIGSEAHYMKNPLQMGSSCVTFEGGQRSAAAQGTKRAVLDHDNRGNDDAVPKKRRGEASQKLEHNDDYKRGTSRTAERRSNVSEVLGREKTRVSTLRDSRDNEESKAGDPEILEGEIGSGSESEGNCSLDDLLDRSSEVENSNRTCRGKEERHDRGSHNVWRGRTRGVKLPSAGVLGSRVGVENRIPSVSQKPRTRSKTRSEGEGRPSTKTRAKR